MDPTTTLVTFMLQTPRSSQSLSLVGSWDNFTKRYPMERDVRRSRGQWRGCYSFKDIICDGNERCKERRNGGLKMGSTYYYYYELDDGIEVHDPSVPSTTCCPYLPGQPINLLYVPVEVQRPRSRSASMTCMVDYDIKTMDPKHKFLTPRPPPSLPSVDRAKSSPTILPTDRPSRSVSSMCDQSHWSPRALIKFGLQSASPRRSSSVRKRFSMPPNLPGGDSRIGQSNFVRRSKSLNTHGVSPRLSSWQPGSSTSNGRIETCPPHDATKSIPEAYVTEAVDEDRLANHAKPCIEDASGNDVPSPISVPRPAPPPLLTDFMDVMKPLPELPTETLSPLLPASFWSHAGAKGVAVPRSRFSASTVSTDVISPTESQFDFSEPPSDDEDVTGDTGSGDEYALGPELDKLSFSGYSLPEPAYTSLQTLKDEAPMQTSHEDPTAGLEAGDDDMGGIGNSDLKQSTDLQALLADMSYLGGVIVGQ